MQERTTEFYDTVPAGEMMKFAFNAAKDVSSILQLCCKKIDILTLRCVIH